MYVHCKKDMNNFYQIPSNHRNSIKMTQAVYQNGATCPAGHSEQVQ